MSESLLRVATLTHWGGILLMVLHNGGAAATTEPCAEVAIGWWPELKNVWTPVGWKDHCIRFNVLYNGTIIVSSPRTMRNFAQRVKSIVGEGVQMEFLPSLTGELPASEKGIPPYLLAQRDGGLGRQGWKDCSTPVLWTEWRTEGLLLRQEVFAHGLGSKPVERGTEPLFAWIRLSILHDADPSSGDFYWLLRLTKPHLHTSMDPRRNLEVHPEEAAYPGPLVPDAEGQIPGKGWWLREQDGKVRIAIAPQRSCFVRFLDRRATGNDVFVCLKMPRAVGRSIDVLLPAVPTEPEIVEQEFSLGYDRCLAESNAFWDVVSPSASRVETPEELVNEALRHGRRFAEMLAIRHPDTGQYCMLTGSWVYEALWATPVVMAISMFLDILGEHSIAEKYLEVFRQEQGKVAPPGPAYRVHPGYFATPRIVAAIDWLADHGAVLDAAANHALLTDDPAFIARWTEPILRACEFIRDALRMKDHGGVEGILPAARATDAKEVTQAVWSDGWNFKGLRTAIRFLKRIGHPRAAEFEAVAQAYRQAFVTAFRQAAARMPAWRDSQGVLRPLVPTALPDGGDVAHPFYLDTGPLFLVYAGLMAADDPLMEAALAYFRENPKAPSGPEQPNRLWHELSGYEPCYSWNVFHSHQRGDRDRFLEGMYSLFAGGMSRQTFIACETRGGISGLICTHALAAYCARLAVIDDQIEPGRLHLLRLVPLAWLRTDRETVFERMPTEFGPVSLRFRLEEEGKVLNIRFHPNFRHAPEALVLHLPPLEGLQRVSINGILLPAQGKRIILPPHL